MWNLSSRDEIAGVRGTHCASEGQVTCWANAGEVRVASFLQTSAIERAEDWSARRERRAEQRDYSHARAAREGLSD
jgi:hypothetical protein